MNNINKVLAKLLHLQNVIQIHKRTIVILFLDKQEFESLTATFLAGLYIYDLDCKNKVRKRYFKSGQS